MTVPEVMTRKLMRKELLELAALDVLGLLDEYEAATYTRSFADAPATVQDEVKRLQAEVASDPALLPDEEPDEALRRRVLEYVSEAVEREAAPLATIGRHRASAGGRAAAVPALHFWRAASFVLAAAGLAMAYLFTQAYQSSNELTKAALYNDAAMLDLLLEPSIKDFLLDDSTKIPLKPVGEFDGRAGLYVNEEKSQVGILADRLPATKSEQYVLQVVTRGDGKLVQLQAFKSMGGMGGIRVLNVSSEVIASAAIWQIADLTTGAILFTSA